MIVAELLNQNFLNDYNNYINYFSVPIFLFWVKTDCKGFIRLRYFQLGFLQGFQNKLKKKLLYL